MEDKEGMMITETDIKWKRNKVSEGRRKWLKEGNIRPEKREHSPTVSWRTKKPSRILFRGLG